MNFQYVSSPGFKALKSKKIGKNKTLLPSGIISVIFFVALLIPAGSFAAVWTNEEEETMKGVISQAVPVTFSHCARISSVTTLHSNGDLHIPNTLITGENIKEKRSFPGINSESINDSIVA